MNRPLRILHVNAADRGGGAAKIAHDLFDGYKALGHTSWFAVGKKRSNDPDVFAFTNDIPNNLIEKIGFFAAKKCEPFIGKIKGAGKLKSFFNTVARPANYLDYLRGHEQFYYPATRNLLHLVPEKPDILHAHNLHTGYFDLRALPELSNKIPVVMTLHDTWLLSGHCAYAKTCQRWQTGCGGCPDLSLYPAVRKDNTRFNWQRKKKIYQQSKLYIATPSQWLMNKVHESMLMPGVCETKVIYNGVDCEIFRPGNKKQARHELGLPQEAIILLFAANSIRTNIWKDYKTVKESVNKLSQLMPDQKILLVGLGDDSPGEQADNAQVIFIPHINNQKIIAQYYQATDLYVHAAHADTFPTVILEALASGTPVVATAVDGINEQVKALDCIITSEPYCAKVLSYDSSQATGILVQRGDSESMAHGLLKLLSNNFLLQQLSKNAVCDARMRFDVKRQVAEYLAWYETILNNQENKGPCVDC